jgi:hypothetical protein
MENKPPAPRGTGNLKRRALFLVPAMAHLAHRLFVGRHQPALVVGLVHQPGRLSATVATIGAVAAQPIVVPTKTGATNFAIATAAPVQAAPTQKLVASMVGSIGLRWRASADWAVKTNAASAAYAGRHHAARQPARARRGICSRPPAPRSAARTRRCAICCSTPTPRSASSIPSRTRSTDWSIR